MSNRLTTAVLAAVFGMAILTPAFGFSGVQGAGTAGALPIRLLNCAPNPFGRATAISYQVGRAGPVALTVHDASGRVVRRLGSGYRAAGRYAVRWDGTDGRGLAVPAGVYFLRLNTNGEASSRRVTLIR